MQSEILLDNKGYNVKILCSHNDAYAGEAGSIRLGVRYLTPATDAHGFLVDIIDMKIDEYGDITALTNANIVYIYKKKEDYKPYKIILNIINDSLHTILTTKKCTIIVTGDRGTKYIVRI